MKYIDEFRDKRLIEAVSKSISGAVDPKKQYRFMEVCGTHTMAIARYALKSILPPNIELISGPGCPVCVTEDDYIDKAIALSKRYNNITATFGDMLKVPGTKSSLEDAKARGADVRIVYSTMDAVELARKNPKKNVIFLGVGFETTAPTIASSIQEAKKKKIKNFFVLSCHKLIPPALTALLSDEGIQINGFILPAHVSAVIGSDAYGFLAKKFNMPGVVTGFEPLDVLQGVYMLIMQIKKRKPKIEIQYKRVVKKKGNLPAQRILDKVFTRYDAPWRGLGIIKKSGLRIKKEFSKLDAEKAFKIEKKKTPVVSTGCICGLVLKGMKRPIDCKLFKLKCTPLNPVGPCMVSSEGACAASYKYGR